MCCTHVLQPNVVPFPRHAANHPSPQKHDTGHLWINKNHRILRIVLLVFGLAFCGCAKINSASDNRSRNVTAALLLEEESPMEQVIMWSKTDDNIYQSALLSGNEDETTLLAKVPGIVIHSANQLHRTDASEYNLALCDCAKWEETGFDGGCPAQLHTASGTRLTVTTLALEGMDTNEQEIPPPMDLLPIPVAETEQHRITSFYQSAEITGSIGPYLFVRYRQEVSLCNDNNEIKESGFRVFNLDTRAEEYPLSEDEQRSIEEKQKKEAMETISNSTGFTHVTENDVRLAQIHPIFINGIGFGLGYEFEARSKMNTNENNWHDYSKTVTVQADAIPKKFEPYVIAPAPIRRVQLSGHLTPGGWSNVTGNDLAIQKMIQLSTEG
ncbi:MAG: hypothetical protein JXX29_16575 [Deltaproteobacteria bacterium]|nr:hypothetical protein [Deltaproteobacteria bacterium]MBN2673300.1 hypothetical protein [Deltaproteobacteria bacterium]